jgi:hypothetical protein
VTRKVVVSDGITLIVVVMWLQLGWFMNRGRAWNWTFIAERRYLDPKRGHPTIAMVDHHLVYLKSHLEVYCLTHASCGEKNTVSVSTWLPKQKMLLCSKTSTWRKVSCIMAFNLNHELGLVLCFWLSKHHVLNHAKFICSPCSLNPGTFAARSTPTKSLSSQPLMTKLWPPKSLLRYLWMLEPVAFIAPLGTGQMDVEKSELQVEWWWWWEGWEW